MSNEFVSGLILGVPVGIATDVLGRPVQRFLDRREEVRDSVRAKRVKEEIAGDRQRLRDWIVLQVLETALVGAMVSIGTGLIFGAVTLINKPPRWLPSLGQAVAIIGGVVILRIAGDAIAVARSMGVRFEKRKQQRE